MAARTARRIEPVQGGAWNEPASDAGSFHAPITYFTLIFVAVAVDALLPL